MNKLVFLLTGLICVYVQASAQRQNVYFLKNSGEYVTQRDSADFIRVIQEPEKGDKLYIIKEYFINGKKKSMVLSSKIDPLKYEGVYIAYFENGKKRQVAHYHEGVHTDTTYNFYPNGNLYNTLFYTSNPAPAPPSVYIKNVKDSTGKDLVIDGNGSCGFYDDEFMEINESGKIKNGTYDGVWTGKDEQQQVRFTETYADGKLISGESTNGENVTTHYTKVFVQPEYKGGMNKFYRYLATNVIYPPSCYNAGIQGVVLINFMVQKDGTLSNIKVTNYVHPDLAAEALRVLKKSPAWIPGLKRGRIERVVFNVPVSFSLR